MHSQLPWRTYIIIQKYTKRDGTISKYKVKNKKFIKSNRHKPQKKGLERKSIYSKRFGYLDFYNRQEQHNLVCPSGYSIGQCFNVMAKLWFGYKKARDSDKSIEKMKKYAKALQAVQEDMGIKTTSFPHLGLYGDSLVLNDRKGNRIYFKDHSGLKQKQKEYEKWQADNAKKIQEIILKPDKEKGETIETFADDVYPYEMEECEKTVPCLLNPEESQDVITFADTIPFRDKLYRIDSEE